MRINMMAVLVLEVFWETVWGLRYAMRTKMGNLSLVALTVDIFLN